MYLRISRGRFDTSKYDELLGLTEAILAAVRSQPGFQSYHGGANRAAGTLVAVSGWDSEEHANFPREALGAILPRLQTVGVQLEPADIYEVLIQG